MLANVMWKNSRVSELGSDGPCEATWLGSKVPGFQGRRQGSKFARLHKVASFRQLQGSSVPMFKLVQARVLARFKASRVLGLQGLSIFEGSLEVKPPTYGKWQQVLCENRLQRGRDVCVCVAD